MGTFKNLVSVAIPSICLLLAFNANAESLRGVVAKTVRQNPDVQVQAQIRNASRATVDEARSGYFPSLDVNAGFGRERAQNINNNFTYVTLWRTDFGLAAKQMIFDGFATVHEVARTKAKTNADSYRVWGTAEDMALSAVQAYLDVLRNEELVGVAERNVGTHTHTFGLVRHLSEQGVGREADTQQTRGRVELAEANLKSARKDLENARITFQKVTGIMPHRLEAAPDIKGSVIPRNEQEALQLALSNHPILKAAITDIAQARGQYNASKSKFYPRIDFVVTGYHNKNEGGVVGPNDDRLAELQLQYNILQGGKDTARMRETGFQVEQACAIRNRTERQVIESMKLSWSAYETSQMRMPLLVQHKQASAETTKSYNEQFGLGKRTILDVLDSQNEYYTASQDLINERYALLFAKYRILNSMGRIVEYINVPLPPEACIPYHCTELD